jgi:hypothetical protein
VAFQAAETPKHISEQNNKYNSNWKHCNMLLKEQQQQLQHLP